MMTMPEIEEAPMVFLIAWSAMCAFLSLVAGCWCSSRCMRRSAEPGPVEGDSSPGPQGPRAAVAEGDAKKKRPKSPKMTMMPTRARSRLYHTDADDTMAHVRPDCTGLRARTRRLMSRQTCSLCCGGVEMLSPP